MKSLSLIISLFVSLSLFGQNIKEIETMIASERFDDAYSSLMELKNSEASNPFVYFELGETVLKSYISDPYSDNKNNVVNIAKGFFSQGIKVDSLNPLNYVGFGILELYTTNDTVKADVYFNKAYKLIPLGSSGFFSKKNSKITDIHITSLIKLETSELYSATPRYYKSNLYNSKLIELRPDLADVYIANGDVYFAQSKASEAIAKYKKALYLKNTALTNVLIAKIYYLARNTEAAKRYYEDALNLDSLFAPAYKGLGNVYYKLGKNKLAKENFSQFLQLTGNNTVAKINYVKALYKAKDYDETITVSEDILKVDSSKNYIYRLAAYSYVDKPTPDMNKALYYIQKLFSKMPENDLIVQDYSYYGKILLSLKKDSANIRKGVEMLEKAYLADTTNTELFVEVLKNAYYNKLYDIEIVYLTKGINNGDNSIDKYMILGKAYYYSKDFVHADSIFSIVIKKDSLQVEAMLWKAYSLSSLDPDLKKGLANDAFKQIIETTQDNKEKYLKERFEAMSYLGSYYMFSPEVDFVKAIDYLKQSLDVDPKNTQWQLKSANSLAFAYYNAKQWRNAKTYYEMELKLNPNDTTALKMLNDINKFLKAK